MHYRIFLISLLFTAFLATSCAKKTEETQTPDTSQALTDKIKVEWDEFKTNAQIEIDSNKARISRLRDKAGKGVEKTIDSLEARNETLKQQLAEFKVDADTSWQRFKREFKRDMDDLGQAISNLFKDNTP